MQMLENRLLATDLVLTLNWLTTASACFFGTPQDH
jgi:hypothetical protein